MTLHDIKILLDADAIVGDDNLDVEIKTAFAADLMSDVMAMAKEGSLLLTGLTNTQVIRTVNVLDIAAIVLVRGKTLAAESIALAAEFNIPVLATAYTLFETAGRLYAKGIVGCLQRVENNRP